MYCFAEGKENTSEIPGCLLLFGRLERIAKWLRKWLHTGALHVVLGVRGVTNRCDELVCNILIIFYYIFF